jgi:hypothetical protein
VQLDLPIGSRGELPRRRPGAMRLEMLREFKREPLSYRQRTARSGGLWWPLHPMASPLGLVAPLSRSTDLDEIGAEFLARARAEGPDNSVGPERCFAHSGACPDRLVLDAERPELILDCIVGVAAKDAVQLGIP